MEELHKINRSVKKRNVTFPGLHMIHITHDFYKTSANHSQTRDESWDNSFRNVILPKHISLHTVTRQGKRCQLNQCILMDPACRAQGPIQDLTKNSRIKLGHRISSVGRIGIIST